jgi:hypothetical protein
VDHLWLLRPTRPRAIGSGGEGEAVIGRVEYRAAPFCEPWPGWRPDPAWCRPELPAEWAVVQE